MDFEDGIIKLPKIGKVEAIVNRQFEDIIKKAVTISKSCICKQYTCNIVKDKKGSLQKKV